MPFTGSHPAAVLPFLRTPLPASALVLGSLAPDVPYYVPGTQPWPTHSALGAVTVDVLIGAAGWLAWHGVLSRPALAVAPPGVRGRVGRPAGLRQRLRTPRDGALVLLALAVGSATHVAWDEFTHAGRWATEHIGPLAASWLGRPGYDWAQDGSGLAGAAVLAWWLTRWWRRTPGRPVDPEPATRWVWPGLAAAGALAGAAAAAAQPDPRSAAVVAAFRGGGAAALGAVLLALGWHARRRQEQRR